MKIEVTIENGIKSIVYTELTDEEEQQLVEVYENFDMVQDIVNGIPYLQVWIVA